ncbi:MAG: murein hydrolase activator EnvC family protein [Candidatus Cryptobacteroides sp.]
MTGTRNRIFALRVLAIAVVGWLCCGSPAYSQDTKAQEARKARLQKEIEIIDGQLKANAAKSSSALGKLTLVQKKVDARKELLAESDRLISRYSKSISAKEKEIKAAQQRLDTLSDYYTRLVRSAYKNRNAKVWYMYILASDDLAQAFRRYGYLRDLSSQMKVQAEKIQEAKAALESEKAGLETLKKEAEAVRKERAAELGRLQAEEAEARNLVNQLARNKKKYQSELDKKQREVEALNREIERIIRNAMGDKKGDKSSSRTEIDYKLAGEFKANKGKLPWPVEGPVVDRFGQNYHPVYTKIKLHFNNGINIAVPADTPVKAVFDGVVKQIVVMPGYNKCVLIQHGDYFSFYCKLGNVSVKAGDKVKTSQTIGTVDTMNGETQLHFQIWSGKTPQNPENWLRP